MTSKPVTFWYEEQPETYVPSFPRIDARGTPMIHTTRSLLPRYRQHVALGIAGQLLLAAACTRAPEPPPAGADTDRTAASATTQLEHNAAKAAIALLLDNKRRCLGIARYRISQWDTLSARNLSEEEEAYNALREARAWLRPEQAVADETRLLVQQLLAEVETESAGAIAAAVEEMWRSNSQLCREAMEEGYNARHLEERVADANFTFSQATRRIEGLVPITSQEARLQLSQFADALQAVRQRSTEDTELRAEASDQIYLDPVANRPISADEYARKKREWDALQKSKARRKREIDRRQAERRAELEKRQLDEDSPAVRTVGKIQVDEDVLAGRQQSKEDFEQMQRMRSWHEDYVVKASNTKRALSVYLKARGNAAKLPTACRTLAQRCEALLADQAFFGSADPVVNQALWTAFSNFRDLGKRCAAGDSERAAALLAAGEAALGEAADALKRYGLRP